MNANRKSDEFVLPTTSANKGATEASAELIEERNSAKRNTSQAALPRTLSCGHFFYDRNFAQIDVVGFLGVFPDLDRKLRSFLS